MAEAAAAAEAKAAANKDDGKAEDAAKGGWDEDAKAAFLAHWSKV